MPTILVVDDDDAISATLVEVLTDEGYQVAVSKTGDAALSYLRANPSTATVLLDLMMPGLDGYEFREHQLKDPHIAQVPVIILTAQKERHEALHTPAFVFRKPVELNALLNAIHDVCTPPS